MLLLVNMGWKEWSFFAILFGLGDLSSDAKTFYTYPRQEISSSEKVVNSFSLQSIWDLDAEINQLISERTNLKATPTRVRAYLYSAACDFGCLTKGQGDLKTFSHELLRIFFTDLPKKSFSDSYSEEMANRVLLTYQTRYTTEEKKLQPALIKQGENLWKPKGESIGLYNGSAAPWYVESAKMFIFRPLPSPESSYWQDQLQQLKESRGEEGDKGLSRGERDGPWQNLLKEQAKKENVDPLTYLYQRALLERTLQDTMIVVFEGKYKMGVRRPDVVSKGVIPKAPTPSHPSYPSLFSAEASAATTILSAFYPNERPVFEQIAQKAVRAHLQKGIHYPIDTEEGVRVGRLVAQKALREEK